MTENSPEPPMAGRTSSVGIFNTGNPLDGLKFVTGMLEDGVAEEVLQLALSSEQAPQWVDLLSRWASVDGGVDEEIRRQRDENDALRAELAQATAAKDAATTAQAAETVRAPSWLLLVVQSGGSRHQELHWRMRSAQMGQLVCCLCGCIWLCCPGVPCHQELD